MTIPTFGAAALEVWVVALTVKGWVLPGVRVSAAGDNVHAAYWGAPEHARDTVPLNPALPVSARDQEAVCPLPTVLFSDPRWPALAPQ
jgi:hypothetical protein